MTTVAFPQARTCPYQPAPGYDPLRGGEGVKRVRLYDGREVWAVTGHAEARALLADPRVSADRQREDFPVIAQRFARVRRGTASFITMDEPEHGRQRRMVTSEFTVRRFKEMRPQIEQIVATTLDAMVEAGSPTDLAESYSLPIPSMVICRMLGVPYADHGFFQTSSRHLIQSQDPEEIESARVALITYLTDLASDPPPGLIARVKAERLDEGELTPEELASMALLLLVAGHETTASMITLSAIALIEHPDQVATLLSGPDGARSAVEELLRYLTIVDSSPQRLALEDIEVGDTVIRAGEGIVIASSVVNRDADVFPDPDELDLDRGARNHVAFGYGVHQCLGQNLARMELQLALPALFERLPTLRLDVPTEELAVRPPASVQGVNYLPVAW